MNVQDIPETMFSLRMLVITQRRMIETLQQRVTAQLRPCVQKLLTTSRRVQRSNLLISVNAASVLALFENQLIEARPKGALVLSHGDTFQAVPLDDKHKPQPWRQADIIPQGLLGVLVSANQTTERGVRGGNSRPLLS